MDSFAQAIFDSIREGVRLLNEKEHDEKYLNFPTNAPERIHNSDRKVHFLIGFEEHAPNRLHPYQRTYASSLCKIEWIENWTSSWDNVTCKSCLNKKQLLYPLYEEK